eukprot:4128700-Pleurochrysis_carterae.AAC.1
MMLRRLHGSAKKRLYYRLTPDRTLFHACEHDWKRLGRSCCHGQKRYLNTPPNVKAAGQRRKRNGLLINQWRPQKIAQWDSRILE